MGLVNLLVLLSHLAAMQPALSAAAAAAAAAEAEAAAAEAAAAAAAEAAATRLLNEVMSDACRVDNAFFYRRTNN